MITSFEVGAVFKIVDEATATFRHIAEQAKALNAEIKALTDQARALNRTFRSTFRLMEGNIATSAGDVRLLADAWRSVAIEASAAERAIRGNSFGVGGNPRQRIAGPHTGGGGNGFHVSSFGVPVPGGHIRGRFGGNAAMLGAGAIAYGVYEEAEIEDIAARAIMTGQIGVDSGLSSSALYKKIRDIIQRNAAMGGFDPKEVGEAILGSERQFAGLPFDKRMDVLNVLLPAAMQEARFKETGLKESAESLVGLAHMTGTYDPAKLPELYRWFNFASMITPAPLPQFTRALSYSMPSLVAGMGMDPQAIMFLTAMNQAAGITSSKAGTWLQSFFGKLMPETGINLTRSKEAHNEALRSLGLLDSDNKPSWMVAGPGGKTDWLGSLLKLAPILGDKLQAMPETQRLQMLDQVFGKQGGREAGLMNLPEFIGQFPRLAEMLKLSPSGEDFLSQLDAGSPVQQARGAFSDLKNVLMDIGSVALPPITSALRSFDEILKSTKEHWPTQGQLGGLPKPGSLGDALGKGMGEGVLPGAAVGAGIGAIFGGVGAVPGAILGGASGAVGGGLFEAGRWLFGGAETTKNVEATDKALAAVGKDASAAAGSLSALDSVLKSLGIGGGASPIKKSSYDVLPMPGGARKVQVHTALNIDGRQFARAVTEHVTDYYEFPAQAPFHDGRSLWSPPDMQTITT